MNIQAFRSLTPDAKLEVLFSVTMQTEIDLSVLTHEVKNLKKELYYLKNRFDDFKRAKKKKEVSRAG